MPAHTQASTYMLAYVHTGRQAGRETDTGIESKKGRQHELPDRLHKSVKKQCWDRNLFLCPSCRRADALCQALPLTSLMGLEGAESAEWSDPKFLRDQQCPSVHARRYGTCSEKRISHREKPT